MQAQAVEYVRRPRLLGLGATPAMPTHDKKKDKDPKHRGRPEPEKKDLVVYDEQGNIKHTMKKGDKLVERRKEGPAEGKWMRVLKGQHEGLRCKVIKIHDKVYIPWISNWTRNCISWQMSNQHIFSWL